VNGLWFILGIRSIQVLNSETLSDTFQKYPTYDKDMYSIV
jgi:hypothetical protein